MSVLGLGVPTPPSASPVPPVQPVLRFVVAVFVHAPLTLHPAEPPFGCGPGLTNGVTPGFFAQIRHQVRPCCSIISVPPLSDHRFLIRKMVRSVNPWSLAISAPVIPDFQVAITLWSAAVCRTVKTSPRVISRIQLGRAHSRQLGPPSEHPSPGVVSQWWLLLAI